MGDVMAKFGAILAQGIIDAGGRNVTVSLQSRTGHTNMMAVVGMLVFTQYWYWFPLSHFLSLAFTPSCVIGLNENLDMPVMKIKSNAKPATYAYPPPLEEKKKEDKEKVATAVLSITAKQKKKDAAAAKKAASGGASGAASSDKPEKMDVEEEKKDSGSEKKDKEGGGEKKEAATDAKKDEEKKEEKKPDPTFDVLNNPARVMKPQLQVISLEQPARYKPVKDISIGGIIMMKKIGGEGGAADEEEEEIVKPVEIKRELGDVEEEPEPPEPFEYTE